MDDRTRDAWVWTWKQHATDHAQAAYQAALTREALRHLRDRSRDGHVADVRLVALDGPRRSADEPLVTASVAAYLAEWFAR